MLDIDLVVFLKENNSGLLAMPVVGDLKEIWLLYEIDRGARGQKVRKYAYERFLRELRNIAEVAPGSLQYNQDLWGEQKLDMIDQDILGRLILIVHGPCSDRERRAVKRTKPASLLERLTQVLEDGPDERLVRHTLLDQLNSSLAVTPASVRLAKERAQNTVPVAEYIPVCFKRQHTMLLSSYASIVNNKIVSLQSAKLTHVGNSNPGFIECLQNNIHYVPNLKPQTDLNLGDCSYLDTCHKLNTCRYVHYLQYISEGLKAKIARETKQLNKTLLSQRSLPFYIHGNCSSDAVRQQLPQQWIRCDVRKFDFSVLGKFSAVIADPAWNIHMNLPYGTCNDIELLDLPLNQLQDEGVLFLWVTGRAIDLGKESLEKWGYKVLHEISWIKTNQLGRTIVTGRTGHWLNHSKEHLLLGLKGNPPWINKRLDTDLIVSAARETSRKPDELYGLIERLVGPHARKLEIFGRDHNVRPGWFTIGNQLTGNHIHEKDVKIRYERFIGASDEEGGLVTSTSNLRV